MRVGNPDVDIYESDVLRSHWLSSWRTRPTGQTAYPQVSSTV